MIGALWTKPVVHKSFLIAHMLFAFVLALIAIIGGALATYFYDEGAPVVARLCAGACIGFAVLGLAGFAFASLMGLTPLALILAATVVASPLILLAEPQRRAEVRGDLSETANDVRRALLHPARLTTVYFIFYTLVGLVLWLAFDRAMFERADGIYTGAVNNYGDLPFHLSVLTSFAYGGNFPPEDPTYAGARFTYPFLADFVAAMFVRAGASLRDGMFLEGVILSLAFVGLLHRWGWELVRDRAAALITPVLVLLSGGLGWLLLLNEWQQGGQSIFDMLMKLPHDYTLIPNTSWRWANALTSLLIPQRGMLLGLPLALIVFTQWWTSLEEGKSKKVKGKSGKAAKAKGKKREEKIAESAAHSSSSLSPFSSLLFPSAKRMIAAGVVAGLLPLAHAHSFVVVMVVGSCVALLLGREKWREWAAFFVVALVVAAPQLWLATHGSSVRSGDFFGWQFGWDSGQENVLWFWLKNTGLFIPLILAAVLWHRKTPLVPRRLVLFYLPFTLCFIIPNVIKLAPWVWDNIKVLFYWYIASAPLVALVLVRLWRGGGAVSRAAACALFISLTLAGGLDVWRIVSQTTEYREFDRDGIAFAEMIKQKTEPRALILHAPTFNHPVFLTGRRSLMGYPGHIWTHGLEFAPREAEIKRMYEGAAGAVDLLARYGIEYAVVGPLEQNQMTVNTLFFERYVKIGEVGDYRLYKMTHPLGDNKQ